MGVYAKATPLRMLGVAVLATATLVLFGGGAAKAKDLDGDYTLTNDITEQIRIVENRNVVLNLNGYDVTTTGEDAIVVEKGATLTVIGDGTIEATGKGWASLYNKGGEVVLNDGTFLKDDGKGSYYTILNHGGMVINDGVMVQMINGAGSSLIDNGYYNFTDTSNDKQGHIAGLNYEKPTLTINGGTFDGGMNTVKNDDNGVLEINGGTFSNTTQVAVMNWNETTINGGTFNVANGAALSNGGYGLESVDRGLFVINGGIYNAEALFNENAYDEEDARFTYDPVKVNGGEFNVHSVMVPDLEPIALPCITGGLFTDDSIELPDLPAGYYDYIVKDGATLVTDEEVDFATDYFVVNLTVGDSYLLDLPQLVLDNATISLENLDGVIDRLDNEILTVHPGISMITVEFNGEVQTYVFNIAAATADGEEDSADEAPEVTAPVTDTNDNEAVSAPNTGIATDATSGAADGASILAAITTALAMLIVLAGIRIAAKEND